MLHGFFNLLDDEKQKYFWTIITSVAGRSHGDGTAHLPSWETLLKEHNKHEGLQLAYEEARTRRIELNLSPLPEIPVPSQELRDAYGCDPNACTGCQGKAGVVRGMLNGKVEAPGIQNIFYGGIRIIKGVDPFERAGSEAGRDRSQEEYLKAARNFQEVYKHIPTPTAVSTNVPHHEFLQHKLNTNNSKLAFQHAARKASAGYLTAIEARDALAAATNGNDPLTNLLSDVLFCNPLALPRQEQEQLLNEIGLPIKLGVSAATILNGRLATDKPLFTTRVSPLVLFYYL